MSNFSRVTPEGTKDILFEDCRTQRYIEKRLAENFILRGYNEVLTPGVEYYDVFGIPGVSIPQQEMYKTTDNNGRLIVFRPDSTLPIARMASARLQNFQKPVRLFYRQNVYRNTPDHTGVSNEAAQMGIEILGAQGLRADLEAIMLAADTLTKTIGDFRLEIGNAVFFQNLVGKLQISEERREQLRTTIESKNYAALSGLLENIQDQKIVEAIRKLPRLFGGEEIFKEAERYCPDGDTADMLLYMKTLYRHLSETALKDRIIVDLGLVQRNDYYTGIIFSAYTQEYGAAVLNGGRYDTLLGKFGDSMPAIGFSVDTDALTAIVRRRGGGESRIRKKTIVHIMPGYEIKAHRVMDEMVGKGRYCEASVFDAVDKTRRYASVVGIHRLMVVGESVTEMELGDDET